MPSSEAEHEFGALNTLLLVVILGLCILSAYLIKQNSFYYLPESAAAIVVGIIVGGLARAVYPSTEELAFLSFEPELFFFLLLPPIIFEAGYSLEKRAFFANFWSIALFAVFGTIISTFMIGFLVYGVGLTGLVEIDTSSPMEALVFGALISAVDPVATLSIMGNPELNCDPLLYALVFGESVLNDAVAIVLFKSFMSFYESEQEFSSKTIPIIMTSFTIVSLSSVAVGILTGLLCSYLCKHTQMRLYPEYEISMLFLFAYGSYSFSEALGLSGIMSLFFCGIVLSHYNSHNLSPTSQITAHNIFKSLAVLSEYFVFLYIGMGLFTGKYREIHVPFFILCTLFCLFARLFNIIPLSWLANLGRKVPIPTKMQVVMWFAGLRGAIAFALSQNMPSEHKDVYISTTLGIVITTTLVCGGLTEPILSKMGMRVIGERAAGASPGADTHVRAEHGDVDHGDLPPLSMGEVMTEVSAEVSAQRSRASNAFFNFIGGDSNEGGAARVERRYEAYEHLALQDDGSPMQSSSAPGLAGSDVDSAEGREGSLRPRSLMERFDRDYMQPLFGGPQLGVTPSRPDNAGHIELTSGSLVRGGSRGESGSGSDRGESKSGTRNSNKGNTSSGVSRDGGAEQRHLSAQPLPA